MKSYEIKLDRKVEKDLKSVHPQDIKRIKAAIQELSKNPRPNSCKKLKGKQQDFYRIRVGNYRIVYTIQDDILLVLVVRVCHRREIYENF